MYKVAILKNETMLDHLPWIDACNRKHEQINYEVIDLTANNWIEHILEKDFDLLLLRPPGRIDHFKRLYDERVFILTNVLKKKVYPKPEEVFIYENKRFLRDWLIAQRIPHPETYIFYDKDEANNFSARNDKFPVVAKTNIGASGNGIVFLNTKSEMNNYIASAFSKGIKAKSGPKLSKGSLYKKIRKIFANKAFLGQRMKDYHQMAGEVQKGFVILQEFIPHEYEWRCIRIGDSFFAHKKIARNNKSSGTLLKGYDPVPESLLDFIREITDKAGLSSASIDVFEKADHYLVNEIQCFFGQSDPYQMLVKGKPGRYRHFENAWSFEEGDFARNACYDLRLEHALSYIQNK